MESETFLLESVSSRLCLRRLWWRFELDTRCGDGDGDGDGEVDVVVVVGLEYE